MTPLGQLVRNIMRHAQKRRGRMPARYCVNNRLFAAARDEMIKYREQEDRPFMVADIDRYNFLVLGVPVIGR